MDERETRAMMEDVAAVMKSLVRNAVTPLVSRLEAMEKRLSELPAPKDGRDGKDADVDEIAALAAASLLPDIMEVRTMVEALPAPVELPDIPAMISEALAESEGQVLMQCNAMIDKRVELEVHSDFGIEIKQLRTDLDALSPQIEAIGGAIGEEIAEHVGKALASIPVPLTADETKAMIAEAVAALPPAEKGKDADPVEVAALVTQEAERILAGWERPQDGKHGEPGEKGVDGAPGRDGVDGKDGRDGLDVVKFIRDDRGHLNGILRDGTTVDLGEYVGKDGKDVSLDVVERLIAESVAKIAPPEIERDAYLAEFAPDDVASNVSLAVKMMAAMPHMHADTRSESHPINVSVTMPEMKAADTTVNVSLPEQVPPNVTVEPAVVNVSPAHVTINAKRGKEVTTVTGYDKTGRIKTFEKQEVNE